MSQPGAPSPRRRSDAGFSLIELLVAMVVFVIVLGIASSFFARQAQLQRAVQARNDVQDRVRVVAQLVTQDLALAGASLRIGSDGRIDTAAGQAGCAQVGVPLCAEAVRVSDTATTLRVRYLSSQFASADACRDVAYRLVGGTLQRSDVRCGAGDAFLDLAPDVLGFKIVIVCSDNVTRTEEFGAGSCSSSNAYGRSAVVSVAARSTIPTTGSSAALVLASADGNGIAVPCPVDRVCFGVSQEVLLPNLKDR